MMKRLILTVITIILVSILAIGCPVIPETGGVTEYAIGDTGPAGGIIFYDKGSFSDGWQYLEAAPYDMQQYNNEPVLNHFDDTDYGFMFGYYRTSDDGNNLYVNSSDSYTNLSTRLEIGEGKRNTDLLVAAMGENAYAANQAAQKTELYAAKLCDDLVYNSYDDWFLPSRDELVAMEEQKAFIPNISESIGWIFYWSSSEGATSSEVSRVIHFTEGQESEITRSTSLPVRCIRRF
jgi:hypothetical protein